MNIISYTRTISSRCFEIPRSLLRGCSLKIPRLRNQVTKHMRQVFQMPCNKMRHPPLLLQHPINRQQLRSQQLAPLSFSQVAPHHYVDGSSFVLQCQEGHPTRGTWALAANHQAGRTRETSMRE